MDRCCIIIDFIIFLWFFDNNKYSKRITKFSTSVTYIAQKKIFHCLSISQLSNCRKLQVVNYSCDCFVGGQTVKPASEITARPCAKCQTTGVLRQVSKINLILISVSYFSSRPLSHYLLINYKSLIYMYNVPSY